MTLLTTVALVMVNVERVTAIQEGEFARLVRAYRDSGKVSKDAARILDLLIGVIEKENGLVADPRPKLTVVDGGRTDGDKTGVVADDDQGPER